jgi:hypothetical protein
VGSRVPVTSDAIEPSTDEEAMLSCLPADGTGMSNPRLKERLGWDDDRYFAARDRLVDREAVMLGRGRGGVVRRIVPSPGGPASLEDTTVEEQAGKEKNLYRPMRAVIAGEWARDMRLEPLAVEITAFQGRRETGGRFTRPDIVAVEVRTFRYLPGKTLEVITFEVKPSYAIDVTCVYEALAHRGAATRSYVVLHVPNPASYQAELDVIERAAVDHGIGLIVAENPASYAEWETRADAVRVQPDPARLEDFIHRQLSDTTKNLIKQQIG